MIERCANGGVDGFSSAKTYAVAAVAVRILLQSLSKARPTRTQFACAEHDRSRMRKRNIHSRRSVAIVVCQSVSVGVLAMELLRRSPGWWAGCSCGPAGAVDTQGRAFDYWTRLSEVAQ